jgi:phosphate transport system substrate-binding protein
MRKMKELKRWFPAGLVAAAAVFFCPPSPSSSGEVLRIGGTGGAIGTMKRLVSAYSKSHPDIRIELMPSIGSGGAVKAVSKGVLDIGLIARPLKESEGRLNLRVREYAVTPLVFATSTTCPMTDITTEELIKVYRGERRRWPCGDRVRLVLRPAGDSDMKVLRRISPALSEAVDEALARPGMFVALTDQEAADVLGRSPERFGTSTLALIVSEERPLRALSFNDVVPTLQALVDGSYPLSKTFAFVNNLQPSRHRASFIDFVFSPEGRKILEESGSLPAGAISGI